MDAAASETPLSSRGLEEGLAQGLLFMAQELSMGKKTKKDRRLGTRS